ncbi:hypothetical protein HDU86_004032 [Geranomyces michiganensis]|nr:hypothetical protein HDU86_004032 [Geranomyces michiganensis]
MSRVSLLALLVILFSAVFVGSRPTPSRASVKGQVNNQHPPATVVVNQEAANPTKTNHPTSPDSMSSESLAGQPCNPETDVWTCQGDSFLACTFAHHKWIAQDSCSGECLDDPAVRPLCFRNANGTTAVATETATATIAVPPVSVTGLVIPVGV